MSNSTIPLSLMVEETHKRIKIFVHNVMDETCLPAFLIELILNEILAEVRQKEYFDISNELVKVLTPAEPEKEESGEESR